MVPDYSYELVILHAEQSPASYYIKAILLYSELKLDVNQLTE